MGYTLSGIDYSTDKGAKRSSGDAAPLDCRGRFVHGLLGAVLAGGGSRRFGSPKALALLHGKPLWKVAAERLGAVCDDVVAIASDLEVASAIGIETIPDRCVPMGPLGGIDAALARAVRTGHDATLVLAVDMPWVGTKALNRLAEAWREHDRTVLPLAGSPWGFEPLCGIYPVRALTPLGEALANRRLEVGAFARGLDPTVIDTGLQQACYRSVNRPADLPSRCASDEPTRIRHCSGRP